MGEPVILKWRGPLKIGNLPDSKEAIDDLKFHAVYIYLRCYQGGKTLVYVGKTRNFANRLAEHYGAFLSSLAGTLYRDDFSVFRPGGRSNYFRSIQSNLDETLAYAKADAYRTKFVYAQLAADQLKGVESTIIARFKKYLPDTYFALDNTTHRSNLVMDYLIQHDHSELKVGLFTSEEKDQLCRILSVCQNA
jgi:hypothetical protein